MLMTPLMSAAHSDKEELAQKFAKIRKISETVQETTSLLEEEITPYLENNLQRVIKIVQETSQEVQKTAEDRLITPKEMREIIMNLEKISIDIKKNLNNTQGIFENRQKTLQDITKKTSMIIVMAENFQFKTEASRRKELNVVNEKLEDSKENLKETLKIKLEIEKTVIDINEHLNETMHYINSIHTSMKRKRTLSRTGVMVDIAGGFTIGASFYAGDPLMLIAGSSGLIASGMLCPKAFLSPIFRTE